MTQSEAHPPVRRSVAWQSYVVAILTRKLYRPTRVELPGLLHYGMRGIVMWKMIMEGAYVWLSGSSIFEDGWNS